MNRFLISEINKIESINERQYENVQILQKVDFLSISTHLILIILSQNDEITLLVDWQINWIDRIDFNREKNKNIEFNWFCWFLDLDQIHISFDIITLDYRLDDHDSFVSIVEFLKNHVRLWRRCWIDEKRHLRYRIDSKIDQTTKMKWSEKMKRNWDNDQSINKRLWVIERSSACRTHNCRILLTDERMNC
jgi:hypothetical protein